MGFGKDGKGVMIAEKRSQALGALPTDTAILLGTKLPTTEDFRMLKAHVRAIITGLTTGEGIGLFIGLAHGDLTTAQIQLALGSTQGPVDPGDLDVIDGVMKPVFIVGQMKPVEIAETEANFIDALTGAPMIVSKNRWTFSQTISWNWFVYNLGATLTIGSTVKFEATDFGVWVI